MRKATFSFFLSLTLTSFVSFFRLIFFFRLLFTPRLDEGEFIFPFFDSCRLSCFLVEEVSRFSETILAGLYEISPVFFSLPHHWS